MKKDRARVLKRSKPDEEEKSKKKNTNEHGGQMKFQPFQILTKKRTKEKEVQAQAEVQTQEVQTQAWWTPVKHTGKIQYFLIE